MSERALFDPDPFTVAPPAEEPLTYTRRLTARHQAMLAQDKHPANGTPVDLSHTCGDCTHLVAVRLASRQVFKCPNHRLGMSRSEASDIRRSWPACTAWSGGDA